MLVSVQDTRLERPLGVSSSVSVSVKCPMSHTHSEVCWLSYPLWSLAGHHVERSVMALFSSRCLKLYSNKIMPFYTELLLNILLTLYKSNLDNSGYKRK